MRVNKVKIACIRRNVTMRQLAQHLGVSYSLISLMALGERTFHPQLKQRAADFLGCSPEDLDPEISDDDESDSHVA